MASKEMLLTLDSITTRSPSRGCCIMIKLERSPGSTQAPRGHLTTLNRPRLTADNALNLIIPQPSAGLRLLPLPLHVVQLPVCAFTAQPARTPRRSNVAFSRALAFGTFVFMVSSSFRVTTDVPAVDDSITAPIIWLVVPPGNPNTVILQVVKSHHYTRWTRHLESTTDYFHDTNGFYRRQARKSKMYSRLGYRVAPLPRCNSMPCVPAHRC